MGMRRLGYLYRTIAKPLSFVLFGLGAVPIGLGVLPLLFLIVHPKSRFQRVGRRFVSLLMRLFSGFLILTGQISVKADRKALSAYHGMIIAPNHPSLLDVVLLYGLLPGASCVVRSGLGHSWVGAIINLLYIKNDDVPEEMLDAVKECIDMGDNVIIFPEGTRTKDAKHLEIKRGVSYLACETNTPVLPVSILGNDKRGLRKHDPIWQVNPDGRWHYQIEAHEPLLPSGRTRADSKTMQSALAGILQKRLDEYDSEHLP